MPFSTHVKCSGQVSRRNKSRFSIFPSSSVCSFILPPLLFRYPYQRPSVNYSSFLSPRPVRNSCCDPAVPDFGGPTVQGSSLFTPRLERPLTQYVTPAPSSSGGPYPQCSFLLAVHRLAQKGHCRVRALFYKVMGGEDERLKTRAATFRAGLCKCSL